MMLEEVGVQPSLGVEHLVPLKAVAAFGTARFGQASEAVVAQRADDVFVDVVPVGRRR